MTASPIFSRCALVSATTFAATILAALSMPTHHTHAGIVVNGGMINQTSHNENDMTASGDDDEGVSLLHNGRSHQIKGDLRAGYSMALGAAKVAVLSTLESPSKSFKQRGSNGSNNYLGFKRSWAYGGMIEVSYPFTPDVFGFTNVGVRFSTLKNITYGTATASLPIIGSANKSIRGIVFGAGIGYKPTDTTMITLGVEQVQYKSPKVSFDPSLGTYLYNLSLRVKETNIRAAVGMEFNL